jgi:hypothetical protein
MIFYDLCFNRFAHMTLPELCTPSLQQHAGVDVGLGRWGAHRALWSTVAGAFLRSASPLLASAQHPGSDWLSFDNKPMNDWTAALIDATSRRYGLGAVLRSVTSVLGRFFKQHACVQCTVLLLAKTQKHLL